MKVKVFHIRLTKENLRTDQDNLNEFLDSVTVNTELMTVAKIKPESLDDLLKIKGFGEQKIAKIGDDILAVLCSI